MIQSNMKKSILILAVSIASFSFAQEKQWTLQECVNYALENNISVKQAQLNAQRAKQQQQGVLQAGALIAAPFTAGASLGFGKFNKFGSGFNTPGGGE